MLQKSCITLNNLGPKIQWLHSYITAEKIYCVYIAPSEETVREHARQGGFPANRISGGRLVIDPTSAENWQRLSNRRILDARCHTLRKTGSVTQLPVSLQLGAKSSEVLKSLGPPTWKTDERLIYLHEHEVGGTRAGDAFTSSNIIVVHLRNGVVWAIQASKSTSDERVLLDVHLGVQKVTSCEIVDEKIASLTRSARVKHF